MYFCIRTRQPPDKSTKNLTNLVKDGDKIRKQNKQEKKGLQETMIMYGAEKTLRIIVCRSPGIPLTCRFQKDQDP